MIHGNPPEDPDGPLPREHTPQKQISIPRTMRTDPQVVIVRLPIGFMPGSLRPEPTGLQRVAAGAIVHSNTRHHPMGPVGGAPGSSTSSRATSESPSRSRGVSELHILTAIMPNRG